MNRALLEQKVLTIADRVANSQPVEDDFVELKAAWPKSDRRTARRLAGHANAARGEDILWIIGLDEDRGIVGADNIELSDWLSSLNSFFEHGPRLDKSQAISYEVNTEVRTLFGLVFETDNPPYVINTGTSVHTDREVPWREGNRTLSARHTDLIRILQPLAERPTFELVHDTIRVVCAKGNLSSAFQLYAYPSKVPVVIRPSEVVITVVEVDNGGRGTDLEKIQFESWSDFIVDDRLRQIVIQGPGFFHVEATTATATPHLQHEYRGPLELKIWFKPFAESRPYVFTKQLTWGTGKGRTATFGDWR